MPRRAAASDVFHAVADPTRRSILDRLRRGDAHVTELASGFRVSRPAISRHLRVLRKARLVRERREGRQRIYQLEPDRIEQVARWAEEYRQLWQQSLTNLKRRLEKEVEEDSR
ncbi:MAG TPA: metalloregulator ArsR/SmtB family transcription factor [Gemmatimonadaceae bacterium]